MTRTVNAWASVDQVKFYETAVVLGSCGCAHGSLPGTPEAVRPDTTLLHSIFPSATRDGCWLSAVLDDFALIASGPGKLPDVVAACMDRASPTSTTINLRFARNRPAPEERLAVVRNVWGHARNDHHAKSDRMNLMLNAIVCHRPKRVNKALKSLKSSLSRYVGRKVSNSLESPPDAASKLMKRCMKLKMTQKLHDCKSVDPGSSKLESSQLIAWVQLLKALNELYIELTPEEKDLQEAENISQLAKLYRASKSILKLAGLFINTRLHLQISALEIADSCLPLWTEVQAKKGALCEKATSIGHSAKNVGEWLSESSRYRQHAEISLLLFYQENRQFVPIVRYIGCSKRPCLLCDSFIRLHGQWTMRESHARLYPLWTVKRHVKVQNQEEDLHLRNVMKQLSEQIEQHYTSLQALPRNRKKLPGPAESLAHWTRDSLATGSLLSQFTSPCPSLHEADFEAILAISLGSIERSLIWRWPRQLKPRRIKIPAPPVVITEPVTALFTNHIRNRLRWHIPVAAKSGRTPASDEGAQAPVEETLRLPSRL